MGEPATLEVGMSEADFSNKNLGMGGAIIISAWITHKDKGALSVTNVLGNLIGKEQLTRLQAIMRSKPNLVSLCGIADDATEADLSGLGMDADDAIFLASELPDKGAVTKFDISDNSLYAAGGKVLAEALNSNQVMTELNLAKNKLGWKANSGGEADMSGIIALADVIPGMGALSYLNLASNSICIVSDWMQPPRKSLKIGDLVDGNPVVEIFSDGDIKIMYISGIIALASAIKDMGAMTSLNLASNDICSYGNMGGIKAISSAVKVLATILVPFSSLSDLSFNCWCLLLSTEYAGDDEPQSGKQLCLLVWRHGWDQGDFQCYKGACNHFGTIFISI
jgi:hypothetical protein